MDSSGALVLFSGGQDSATCLAWALERFDRVETVGFTYGQRHAVEMTVREPVREALCALRPSWARRLGADRVVPLEVLGQVSVSALTADLPIEARRTDRLPATFVPGRNLLFLTFAAVVAYARGLRHVIGGMCETDYSGYPDCRDDTIKAMQAALNLGMASRMVLDTPLMWLDKAQTWRMAEQLGGPDLVRVIVEETHSCYLGDRSRRHAWGYGCGHCAACELRAHGWSRYAGRSRAAEEGVTSAV